MFAFNHYRLSFTTKWLLLVLTFGLPAFALQAQTDKPCKTQVRANRGQVLVFERLELNQTEWNLGDSIHVTRTDDSIHIQKNGATLTRFKTRGGWITGTRYEEFYPNGSLKRLDSLSTEGYGLWHLENYFQAAGAHVINTRTYYPGGIPQTLRYYRKRYGQDSLRKTWYPNGVLQQTVWAYPSGTDSAVWGWNPEGILSGIRYEGHSREFYPTGILKSSSVDTLIHEQALTCHKAYYPNGVLHSVEYEWQGVPHLTSLYYNEEGVLIKRINHTPPGLPWLPEVVMAEEPMPYFTYVDQLPEFAGGEDNLKKYLNEKLAPITCNSPLPLQNRYEVRFTVNTEGTVTFQSLKGENAEGIAPAVSQCINLMPRWKPGKIAGRPVNVMYGLILKVVEKNQNPKPKIKQGQL